MNHKDNSIWTLILAAGEGSRLRQLTTNRMGDVVPKQFCSLAGGASLLRYTLSRALRYSPASNVTAVVAANHHEHYQRDLDGLSQHNIVVQPQNKGTAIGILLPLLHILRADPDAKVVVLPADHYVHDEDLLMAAVSKALRHGDSDVVLVGIEPEYIDTELGYVVPGRVRNSGLLGVHTFVEKPDRLRASQLVAAGAAWNSFIMAAPARSFVDLIGARYRSLVQAMGKVLSALPSDPQGSLRELEVLYANQDSVDFSRDVLEGREDKLVVVRTASCGWADLGTPERVRQCLQRYGQRRPIDLPFVPAPVNLAEAISALSCEVPCQNHTRATVQSLAAA